MSPKTQNPAKGGELIRRKIGKLELLLAPRPGSGLVASRAYVRCGSADEGPGEIGLASFTSSMLKRGTAGRTSAQIAFDLESLGAMAAYGTGVDACHATLRSAASDYPAALEIYFDCLKNPAFDAKEMEIERQSVLAYLKRAEDEKFDYTYRHYIKMIFAGHGYGHMSDGEQEDVLAIDAEACRAWHKNTFRPENTLFVVAGDFDPDAMCDWLASNSEGWAPPGEGAPRYEAKGSEGPADEAQEATLHQKLEQGFIVMGYRTPELTHPDHAALRLASAALGEGFSGRLFTNLRDERSLAYAVGSSLTSHRLRGHMMLYIGTEPDRMDEAKAGLLDEVEALCAAPLSEEDLSRARNYVAGKYLMAHQSLAARTSHWARWEDSGLGADFDERYVDTLREVGTEDVLRAVRKWWKNPAIVMLRPEV